MSIVALARARVARLLRLAIEPPTLLLLMATATAVALSLAASSPVVDPDGWWVAAAGRDLLATGSIPDRNAYSFTDPARAWVMHEWLFAAPYAIGLGTFGPSAFCALGTLAGALGAGLIVYALTSSVRRARVGLGLAAVALVALVPQMSTGRPTGFALVFPVSVAMVAFGPRFGVRRAAGAIGLVWLWTQAHGSFPLGVALLLVAALDGPRDERLIRGITAALAALSTLVNPYGLGLHRLVLGYAGGGEIFDVIHAHIAEFRPLTRALGEPRHLGTFVLWAALWSLVVPALRRRRFRARGAFCALLLVMALQRNRHVVVAGMLTLVMLAPALEELLDARGTTDGPSMPLRAQLAALVAVLPGLLLALATHVWLKQTRPPEAWVGVGREVIAAVDRLPAGAPVYVPFETAAVAIWAGAPRGVRVFYDSRNDCYSAETARTFFALDTGALRGAPARDALAARGTQWALLPPNHGLLPSLLDDGPWREVGRAGTWRILRRELE